MCRPVVPPTLFADPFAAPDPLTHPLVPFIPSLHLDDPEDGGADPTAAAALLAAAPRLPATPSSEASLRAALATHAAWLPAADAARAAAAAAATAPADRPPLHRIVELLEQAQGMALATPGARELRAMLEAPQAALASVRKSLNKRGANLKADRCIAAVAESAVVVRRALDAVLADGASTDTPELNCLCQQVCLHQAALCAEACRHVATRCLAACVQCLSGK
jgi:hypothetical protein